MKKQNKAKKLLVYAVMFAAFTGFMWLIFVPSKADKEIEKLGTGFNADIPDPRGAVIVGNKKTAYEQENLRLRDEEQTNSLSDFAKLLEREERQIEMGHKPQEYYDDPERFEPDAIRSSASVNAELTGSLGTFFEEPETDPEKEEMAAEIERLNGVLASQQSTEMSVDDQLALLERSYQLAAQYNGAQQTTVQTPPVEAVPDRKAQVEPVTQVRRDVVSRLSAPMNDAEFIMQMSRERNRGFHTMGNETATVAKNTIAAVVYGDQTVIDGQAVRLRTTEAMRVGRHTIPQGAVITGIGTLSGERFEITVTAIEYAGDIIPVELTVCDLDGQIGIRVPGSMELKAFREIAGNMGQGLGTTINLNQQSAGQQLLAEMGRGVIQGTSQYISRKAGQVKIRLKSGHRLLLLPKTN